jgi:biopolymer transport protein ExbD
MSKKNITLISIVSIVVIILLLRDFVISSTKSMAEAKSIAVPQSITTFDEPNPEDTNNVIKIKSSGAVTFLLTKNNIIYYYLGQFNDTLNKTDYKNIGSLIKNYSHKINPKDLFYVIKSDKNATFKNAIDILDEMQINNVPTGRYAEIEITEDEIKSINNYNIK